MRFLFAAVAIAFRMANAKTILFSEIYVRPTSGERGQYIELFNPTGITVDMSKYKVCIGSGSPCTNLSGFLPAGAYYTLCRDLSVYAYCNAGTSLKLDGLSGSAGGLKLIDTTGAVLDSATWPELPVGTSIARGLDLNNLMTFVSTTIPSIGTGFIAGLAPTTSPTLPPTPEPTLNPTPEPSPIPTSNPTPEPSPLPTFAPTDVPTPLPTPSPPTNAPTLSPTDLCAKANCHKLADCILSNGKASCKCKKGYDGDGELNCDDVDECAQTPNPCSQNGYCANKVGSYRCGCKLGYVGDGVNCVDIDECLGNPCGVNAKCTNSPGSFRCTCNSGYSGEAEVSCSDTNECSVFPGPCDRRAYCVNKVGSYECECKAGYFGTGYGAGSCTLISSNPVTTPSQPITPTRPSASRPNVPSVSLEPSMSAGPTITRFPSLSPSLSNEPTSTNVPSVPPSLSNVPSMTNFPSARPSTRPK